MADFKTLAIGFIITSLVITCIALWANGISSAYGEEDALNNEYMNFSAMQNIVDGTEGNSKVWQNASQQDAPTVSTGTLFFSSLWDVMKLIWNSITSIYNIIGQGVSRALGLPSWVFGTFTAILTLSIIIYTWRLLRGTD